MTPIRRLDHVAVAVRDTEEALRYFRDGLGLRVESSEEREVPPVRLTYLDAGNAWIQLLEPLDPAGEFARGLEYGLHHICFGVDDVAHAAAELAPEGAPAPTIGGGRGRLSAFVPGANPLGLRIECTEFRRDDDVERNPGALG